MRIGRTLPPATAPIYLRDIASGIKGLFHGQRELDRFESELKDYFGAQDCFLFSSGKAALAFSLSTLKEMHPGKHEVILPAYVCYSVPSAVVHAGLKVVPCDLRPHTLEMDLEKLSQLLRETTLCVIVPHLFGLPARVSRILKLCHENGVTVIEDAAQAIGVTCNGRMLGTQADIGFFSLGRGKTISTVEGGILLIKDPLIKSRLRARLTRLDSYTAMDKAILLLKAVLLFLFSRPSLYWFPKLLPFLKLGDTIFDPQFPLKKLCGIQAGLARGWKEKVKRFNAQRKKKAQRYLRRLSNNSLVSFFAEENQTAVCLRFPIFIQRLEDKTRILSESEAKGLGIMFTYPDSIDGIPELKDTVPQKRYPVAKSMAQNILTLPVHPMVSEQDMQKIIGLFDKIDSQNMYKPDKLDEPSKRKRPRNPTNPVTQQTQVTQ